MGLSWFQIRPKVSYLSVSRPSKRQAVNDDDKVTRSSWLNCALRDDEAVCTGSVYIGHYEAVAVGT